MAMEIEILARLLLAAFVGAVIGLEREMAHKPAGIRTNSLVSLGACVFTILSSCGLFASDPTRIASGIVTGIGFLGAGVIINSGKGVQGTTTAATIWAAAAIGMGIGLGEYFLSIASVIIVLFVLKLKKMEKPMKKMK